MFPTKTHPALATRTHEPQQKSLVLKKLTPQRLGGHGETIEAKTGKQTKKPTRPVEAR